MQGIVRYATLVALAAALSGCLATVAPPEPEPPRRATGPKLRCAPHSEAMAFLEKHDQDLQSAGVTTGGILAQTYANPETGTWTWLLTSPDGVSCLLGRGQMWRAAFFESGEVE